MVTIVSLVFTFLFTLYYYTDYCIIFNVLAFVISFKGRGLAYVALGYEFFAWGERSVPSDIHIHHLSRVRRRQRKEEDESPFTATFSFSHCILPC